MGVSSMAPLGATTHPDCNQTFSQRYAMTLQKKADLTSMGCKYVCMWEHDFNIALKINTSLTAFEVKLDVQTRLEPRDTFLVDAQMQ